MIFNEEKGIETATSLLEEKWEEINAMDIKCERELKYKRDPYEWTLDKYPSGKTKAVIIEESMYYKNWGDETNFNISKQVMAKMQAIVDSFEIFNGYPKVLLKLWNIHQRTNIRKREEENEILRMKGKKPLNIIPREIVIPKIHLIRETGCYDQYDNNGVVFADREWGGIEFMDNIWERCERYLKEPKLAVCHNGDQIKYNEEGEIEWVFSPRYG
jgi:hypothetical protein